MSALLHGADFRMLCVDPGLRGCGVAEFLGGTLVRAAYVKNTLASGRGYKAHAGMSQEIYYWVGAPVVDLFLIEMPRIYPGLAQQKGDPNDLLDIAGVGGAIAGIFEEYGIESVFPSDWKGQVPADMMTERIKRALTQEEKAKAEKCAASLAHNMWDACGIGLHRLGRLNKKVLHND